MTMTAYSIQQLDDAFPVLVLGLSLLVWSLSSALLRSEFGQRALARAAWGQEFGQRMRMHESIAVISSVVSALWILQRVWLSV
jgi:uncharacterized membrane protein